jgi:hypothetical protein
MSQLACPSNLLCLEYFALAQYAMRFLGVWIWPRGVAAISPVDGLRMSANA